MPTNASRISFELGASVLVKEGVEDADGTGWGIAGNQGRIAEITEDGLLLVTWDSVTLKRMPAAVIEHSEREGLDWAQYYLRPGDVERAAPRDTRDEVRRTQDELLDRHAWASLGEEGRPIQQVLEGIAPGDSGGALQAWETHLSEKLTFPFDAVVAEPQDRGPLHQGDRVRALRITETDDLYGLITALRHKQRACHLPLADLEARDEDAPNYAPLRAYRVWFANR